jgi:hypothetical protein
VISFPFFLSNAPAAAAWQSKKNLHPDLQQTQPTNDMGEKKEMGFT